jgi:hypothetical protein
VVDLAQLDSLEVESGGTVLAGGSVLVGSGRMNMNTFAVRTR